MVSYWARCCARWRARRATSASCTPRGLEHGGPGGWATCRPIPTSPPTSPALARSGAGRRGARRRSAGRRSGWSAQRSPDRGQAGRAVLGREGRSRDPCDPSPRVARSSTPAPARSCSCATSATSPARCSRTRARWVRGFGPGPARRSRTRSAGSAQRRERLVDYVQRRGDARARAALRGPDRPAPRRRSPRCWSSSARTPAADRRGDARAAGRERDRAASPRDHGLGAAARWAAGARSSTPTSRRWPSTCSGPTSTRRLRVAAAPSGARAARRSACGRPGRSLRGRGRGRRTRGRGRASRARRASRCRGPP